MNKHDNYFKNKYINENDLNILNKLRGWQEFFKNNMKISNNINYNDVELFIIEINNLLTSNSMSYLFFKKIGVHFFDEKINIEKYHPKTLVYIIQYTTIKTENIKNILVRTKKTHIIY